VLQGKRVISLLRCPRARVVSCLSVISHVSQAVVIKPGNLIFTGTPAGVGALKR